MSEEPVVGRPAGRGTAPWVAPALVAALLAGGVAGAVVSLALDSDGTGAPRAAADAAAEAVAQALPAVVTVVNELPDTPEGPGGVAGGAGFVVDERGYVVTNAHLVSVQGKLSVVLNDGEIRPATLVSHDAPFTDLAVLRIQAGGLRALPLGDSADLRVGETVVAIGSPDIDYRNSATAGIVSGLGRRKLLEGVFREDLIQTDAAINAGSSGGPVVNLRGEAVGIVSFRDIGPAEEPLFGISFAISSRTFGPIVEAIINQGKFPRPYFGIDHQDIDPELALAAGLSVERGALVLRVIGGSPAERAGLRAGDVLLRIGNSELSEDAPFINALARLRVNERVGVQLLRDGRLLEATLEVTPR